jgi:integrase
MFSKYGPCKEPQSIVKKTQKYSPRKGRPRKWIPEIVISEDLSVAEDLMARFGTRGGTAERVRKDYIEFAKLNDMSLATAIKPFIGQAIRHGLQASTLDTYLTYLRPLLSREKDFSKWAKVIALAHADADAKSAPDRTLEQLQEIVRTARRNFRTILWLILSTGMRVADAARLRRKQIAITDDGHLRIQIRIMKNRRKRRHRFILAIPLGWAGSPGPDIRREIECGDPEQRIFGHLNANVVNDALKKMSGARCTTYTFRRRYINDLFLYFDEVEMKRYTGHFNEGIIQAHYLRFSPRTPVVVPPEQT